MKKSISILISLLFGIVALFGVAGCNADKSNELQSKVNDLQSQIEELNDKLAEMGEQARERDAVIEGLNDRIAEMDEQACEQDATIEDLNEQIKKRDERIKELLKELHDGLSEEELLKSAEFFDKTEKWANKDFLMENQTHYPFRADDLPDDRCLIIDTNAEFARAFDSFPQEVDFTQDFLIVYFFTDIYYGFECSLQTITKDEGDITIEILHDMAEKDENGLRPPSTSQPLQRCLVTKLPICNYKSIKVERIYS